MQTRALYPRQTSYLFANILLFASREGDEATSLSSVAETWGLRLSALHWKRSLQFSKCRGNENGGTLPVANKNLFADLLFFASREGDEATSPSFVVETWGLRLPAHR